MLNYISLHQHRKTIFAALTLLTLLMLPHRKAQAFPIPGLKEVDPSFFNFKNVVRQDPPNQPGGWKTACAKIPFIYVSLIHPQKWTCEMEVGVPEQNYLGKITDKFAKEASATATNEAVGAIFTGGPYEPTTFCVQLNQLTELNLKHLIPGARVSRCGMQ